mgnify:CR=1 FL=1
MRITILAFNLGPTRSFTNGPGMSLYNLCKAISKTVKINIFLSLKAEIKIPNCNIFSINDSSSLKKSIAESSVIHCWSGLTKSLSGHADLISGSNKPTILGPNLFDCVEMSKERDLLKKIRFDKILSVNDRLRYQIALKHKISPQLIETFIVGPDMQAWTPTKEDGGFILWKGNSKHHVKDVKFAIRLKERLTKYNFKIMGYPNPYDYLGHISEAKSASLYINTSLSETKSQTLMESWASGVPSVTHPKIYLHGKNYETGIITNKTLDDYSEAIREIMESKILRRNLSIGARNYAVSNFSNNTLVEKYLDIINRL